MDSVTISLTFATKYDNMPEAGQEAGAKLEAHAGPRGCRKKAVKPEARPSQGPGSLLPTPSFLLLCM